MSNSYNEYQANLQTAKEAIEFVQPLFDEWMKPGSGLIDTNFVTQNELCQLRLGDFLLPVHWSGVVQAVEVKGEWKWTGNLFVETWSNRIRGGKQGWIYSSCADILLMVYLEKGFVYHIPMEKLWNWCFADQNLYKNGRKELKVQRDQANITYGIPVPFRELIAPCGILTFGKVNGKFERFLTKQETGEADGCVVSQ